MRNLNKLALTASSLALGVGFASNAEAAPIDRLPHFLQSPIAIDSGNVGFKLNGVAELGLSYKRDGQGTTTVAGLGDFSLGATVSYVLANGWVAGIDASTKANSTTTFGDTGQTDFTGFRAEDQNAVGYLQAAWGRLEMGHLGELDLAVNGSSAATGRSDLMFDDLTAEVAGLGMGYRFEYGPHTMIVRGDQDLRGKVGYRFIRPIGAFNYTAGVDLNYANSEKVSVASAVDSAVDYDDARILGGRGGLQVDYGRLYVAGGAGFEMINPRAADNEQRMFGSLGVSNKFGRLTVSTGLSAERYFRTKLTRMGGSFGMEYALSRGVTFVGGYNALLARSNHAATATNWTEHNVDAALKISF